jgi:signal transduction histidine kinase
LELRRDTPTPTYAEELRAAQEAAIRWACFIAAPLMLAFALLDRHFAPEGWLRLLGARAVAAVLLCGCALWSRRAQPIVVVAVAVGIVTGTIGWAMFRLHTEDPYLFSVLLVQAGLAILIPMLPLQALLLNLEVLVIALFPVAGRLTGGMMAVATFLCAMAAICVAGATLQDRVRRREHQARAEFARHFGLLNLGTLAGGLAHELSNPLIAMAMQVELLDKNPAASREAGMAMLRRQVERMKNILEAMRNGARINSAEERMVDLTREADLALTLLEPRLRGKVSLVKAYAEVPQVFAQPTLLGQVLVNLLANAADAVAGQPDARIALRVRRLGDEVCVEVEDDGPGIPDELMARIFEPFFSTKGEKGSGLGLWISSEIARMHGGSLTVQRGGAGGALFRLSLPIQTQPKETPA